MPCASALGNGQGFMRGYREPDPEDADGKSFRFREQSEHDRSGLTFRKFGRGHPVRVTLQERDESIERFEDLEPRIRWAALAVCGIWLLGCALWAGEQKWADALAIAGLLAIGPAPGWFADISGAAS